ncbi:MAG TPA: polysaccharide biosynthesis/export family protein [Pyrinomonadaceae bacterium]|nr:polysaccharide biosynthesis/export family protein [Pyrinomonadaceae bacterium]
MKKLSLTLPFLLAVVPAAAQNQVRARITAIPRAEETQAASSRGRTVTNVPAASESAAANTSKPTWGDTTIQSKVSTPIVPASARIVPASAPNPTTVQEKTTTAARLVKPTSLNVNNTASPDLRSAHASGPTLMYRVGVGDVLDVRLTNMATRESTLFTVMKNGQLEYPLLATPISVAGLTPDEVARRLNTEIKVLQNPRASVTVRDYASHAVLVTGAIDSPGRKVLRREAMPLFALLAEASPRSDATVATINRNGKETTLSLTNNSDMSTLVISGDVVKISAPAKEFVYVGGDVASPGEKEFRAGMTLIQALIAAGGGRTSAKATIAKRSAEGLLTTREYDLQQINQGKAPDPMLEAGDRIEVKRAL